MDYARASSGLLRSLLNRVWYVRFPPHEVLGPHRVVQHVLLLDECPVVHLRAVNPLEEVAAHLGLHYVGMKLKIEGIQRWERKIDARERNAYKVVPARVVRPGGGVWVCGLNDLCLFATHTLRDWKTWWYLSIFHCSIWVL